VIRRGRLVVVPFLFLRHVASPGAERAEDRVAGLAQHQLLIFMGRTVRDDFSDLLGHQVDQLVDEEGGWNGHHSSARYPDELSADGTSEAKLAGIRCHNSL